MCIRDSYLIFHVSLQVRHQSNVFNELQGRGIEIHGPENACIVEKVKVRAVLQLLLPLGLLHAWKDVYKRQLYRYKISEIPYMFSYEEGTFIILTVNPLIVMDGTWNWISGRNRKSLLC